MDRVLTVKCDRQQTHTTFHAEKLIDHCALGVDPARKSEIAQRWEDEIREPVPAEGDAEGKTEECVTRHFPRIFTTSR